jgi:hypothetical protein
MFVEESWLDGLKLAIHYAHKSNKALFFSFSFLLDAELELCLKLHQAIFLFIFKYQSTFDFFFLFFQFQRAGIWGTHSKFLFGLPLECLLRLLVG